MGRYNPDNDPEYPLNDFIQLWEPVALNLRRFGGISWKRHKFADQAAYQIQAYKHEPRTPRVMVRRTGAYLRRGYKQEAKYAVYAHLYQAAVHFPHTKVKIIFGASLRIPLRRRSPYIFSSLSFFIYSLAISSRFRIWDVFGKTRAYWVKRNSNSKA